MKIRRKCKCGCGRITNPGKKYIHGHNSVCNKGCKRSEESKIKNSISMIGNTNGKGNKGCKRSKETKLKQSIFMTGKTYAKGCKRSKETKLKQSISHIKYNPNDPYCDIWRDREYRRDLRKDYCENKDCKEKYKRLHNHHIDLNKKNCSPFNIMTLCVSCHIVLHNRLRDGKKTIVNSKDFLVINRPDHISYVNKRMRKKIMIKRR